MTKGAKKGTVYIPRESLPNHPDKGCLYSKGRKCIECPFIECWKDMTRAVRWQFRRDYEIDGAKDWRVNENTGL